MERERDLMRLDTKKHIPHNLTLLLSMLSPILCSPRENTATSSRGREAVHHNNDAEDGGGGGEVESLRF